MKKSVSLSDFREAFHGSQYENNFSFEGLNTLYYMLTSFEDDCGIEITLDVCAICCDFAEYSDFEAFKNDYSDYENIEELKECAFLREFGNNGAFIVDINSF